jgi:hypothetical protein
MPFVEFMRLALEAAQRGYDGGGLPIGSVLVEKSRWWRKDTTGGSRMAIRSPTARSTASAVALVEVSGDASAVNCCPTVSDFALLCLCPALLDFT